MGDHLIRLYTIGPDRAEPMEGDMKRQDFTPDGQVLPPWQQYREVSPEHCRHIA